MSCSNRNRINDDTLITNQGLTLFAQLNRFVGETVTIFTTSGGTSGSGFTGVILSVSPTFIRLVTDIGMGPASPLNDDMDLTVTSTRGNRNRNNRAVGSVVDIPIDRIAAFVHNAL